MKGLISQLALPTINFTIVIKNSIFINNTFNESYPMITILRSVGLPNTFIVTFIWHNLTFINQFALLTWYDGFQGNEILHDSVLYVYMCVYVYVLVIFLFSIFRCFVSPIYFFVQPLQFLERIFFDKLFYFGHLFILSFFNIKLTFLK